MSKQRQIKILSIVALVLAISAMTLGFAAFSTTLNISSSASVTPSSSDFKVVFSPDEEHYGTEEDMLWLYGEALNGAIASSNAIVEWGTVSGLSASFTSTNQSVAYTFYIHNIGQYDAYLRNVSYTPLSNGDYKMCSATTTDSTKATDSLVQAACEGINITISIGGNSYAFDSNISGHILPKGSVEEIQIKIEYADGSAMSDGPFKVDISDFKINYSTVDYNSNLITFYVEGEAYVAEKDMTFSEFIGSSYNPKKFFSSIDGVYYSGNNVNTLYYDEKYQNPVKLEDVIESERNYQI